MGASLLAVAKSIYYWSKKERARGNVTQYFINKQAYEIIFHHRKQNTSDLHPSICNNARCSQAIGSTWNMLTHYQIFRNSFFWPFQQALKLPEKEGIYHFPPHISESFRCSLNENYD